MSRKRSLRPTPWGVAAVVVTSAALTTNAQQQAPAFQASVDVASIDVSVVDDRGQPLMNLGPGDFVVRLDGAPRRVLSADWVQSVAEVKAGAAAFVPEDYSSNDNTTGGRLIVLAVDQPNIRPGGTLTIATAVTAFLDALMPSDRVAVVGLGTGARPTPFTADRERLKQAFARMVGEKRTDGVATSDLSSSESIAIARGDRMMIDRVVNRQCTGARSASLLDSCRARIEGNAMEIATDAMHASDETIRRLRDLLSGLATVEGPKTLILVSEGFDGADAAPFVRELGALAAASRTSVYALQLEDTDFGVRAERSSGLDTLAQAARGAVFQVTGPPQLLFDRIKAELSGYYLLGVETEPQDRDGKTHTVRVEVPRSGALVRARRQMLNAALEQKTLSPRQAAAVGLNSPLLMSELPLRVATFPLQGPEQGKVQLLIHADIGTDYSASKPVSVAYAIFDSAGRLVETRTSDSRLPPVMSGLPSALQFVAGASLPPGEYTLKLAAAEGDRAGSVEHPLHATLVGAGNVTLSALMAGGPLEVGELMRPTVGYTVSFGVLHGYVEAYGPQVEEVTVSYEIVPDGKSAVLMQSPVPGILAGDDRMIFTNTMVVSQLPPGRYVLRAVVSAAAKPVRTLTRAFEVAPPTLLTTSADDAGGLAPAADLFLPVDERALSRPFRAAEALAPDALGLLRDRIAARVKGDFEAGVGFLAAGEYSKAEASFKRAIQPDVDSMGPMVYLAATFAAAGHDADAAGAWQTAISDGAGLPQVYDWLSQALLRTRSLREAGDILEEAVDKWPDDPRFTRPLAMLYALFGKGREGVRMLERYLTARQDDGEAYRMGVDWIYHAHAAGGVIYSHDEDVKFAHEYADAYAKIRGSQTALVRQWLEFLDKEKR